MPRNRKGYVMVELSDDDRAKLETIVDAMEMSMGVPLSMSLVIRLLIRTEFDRRRKIPKNSAKVS